MERHSRTCGTRFGYRALTTTVSLLPLVLAAPAAWAQETPSTAVVEPAAEQTGAADQSGQSEIVVTGTRIQSAGFNQPTQIGRASCREECGSTGRFRWSPDHSTKQHKAKQRQNYHNPLKPIDNHLTDTTF